MLKRLNIENFESIKGKETQNLKIEDAGWDSFNDQYYIMFDIKGNQTSARGEVIIKREPSSRYKGAFYLEIRWVSRIKIRKKKDNKPYYQMNKNYINEELND